MNQTTNKERVRLYLSTEALTTLSRLQSETDHTLSELVENAVKKAYRPSLSEQTEKAITWLNQV